MARIGSITVEVKPTVTLESAAACVMMLNMFLDGNEDYLLSVEDDGKVKLVDKSFVPATGGILQHDRSSERAVRLVPYGTSVAYMSNEEREILAEIDNKLRRKHGL